MSSSRSAVLVAVTCCAATLALVATTNVSCGVVKVPQACAQQCPDIAALQDRIDSLEDTVSTLRAALAPVVFRASLETPQSVPSAQDTVVKLDAVTAGQQAFDGTTHEYVAPVSGEYIIAATVSYLGMDKARANNEIWITKPNSPAVGQTAVTAPGNSSGSGSTTLRINSATVVQLAQGDRVALRAFHDYGANRDLAAGLRETNLQIIRVPAAN